MTARIFEIMPNKDAIPVITIDGPGGAGKGTIAKRIASTLGWHLLDSGMLYRLLALAAMNHRVKLDDTRSLEVMASALDIQFVAEKDQDTVRAFLEGEDVTDAVRSEDAGLAASRVATISGVRKALLGRQRAFVEAPGLVADGRDMGTVVFQAAPLKVYLTASVEARAERRYKQLLQKGQSGTLARLAEAIAVRDKSDMEREVAPLKPAPDALYIDSTKLSIEEVCSMVLEAAEVKGLIAN